MEPEQKSNGALVGSIIIIIILVLGGVYLLKTSMENKPAPANENVGALSTNEATAIEAELDGMDLESLDAEI